MKFFASVPGFLVTRYGTGLPIGATIGKQGVEWNDEVTAIPDDEAARYVREYAQHVAGGELRACTLSEYDTFIANQAKPKKTTPASVEPATNTET
jgi:hypothetical protein